MWPRIFLILLAAGATGAALTIAVITAIKKRYRVKKLAGIGSLIISAIYGAAMIGAYMAALLGARLVLTDLRMNDDCVSEWRLS